MNNIFIDNPITVNVLGINSFKDGFKKDITRQIVWINTKDEKTYKIWESRDHEKLKKMYKNNKGLKKGGNEDAMDEDAMDEDVMDEDDIDDIEFDDDEIENMLKEEVKDDDIDQINEIYQTDETNIQGSYTIVSDIFIFPEDKISDFKKKIFIQTGIPLYRQHVFYEYKGKAFPLSYNISHEFTESIDIRQIYKNSGFYEGLPVDTTWYARKEYLQVHALDDFHLMEHIYYKHNITTFYVVDLNIFINPIRGNLEILLKQNLYAIELIYYSFIVKYWPQLTLSVFGDYIKNEHIIQERFPDLSPSITLVKNIYKLETNLIGGNYVPVLDNKKWDIPIYFSITHSVVSIPDQFVLPGSIIYLRNLFDMFNLNDVTNYIICNDEIEGRFVTLIKTYGIMENLPTYKTPNSILININIVNHGNMRLIINKKGGYKVVTKFREDQYFNFDMIYTQIDTHVKPVIEKINNFGKSITNNKLVQLKNDNSVFTDINLSVFWKFNIGQRKFENVKNILQKYVDSNILIKAVSTSDSLDYYFVKGMFKYELNKYKIMNPVQNQYQYLSDSTTKSKHDTLITKRKKLNVTHRFSDIKVEVLGIKEQEYVTLYMYLLRFFESIPRDKGEHGEKNLKKLKNLKERDPTLYELKKIYNSNLNYSKLCQHQKQPVMHGEPGKNRTKFWNFTSNEPAYYECPGKKYPYINFITKAHPKGYCIPCCYKVPLSNNLNDKKNKVFSSCMDNKTYQDEDKAMSKSRHVLSYGKVIDVGRLSKLPENTLEPLFYDTFSKNNQSIDDECIKDKRYYLFGVPQHINNVSYVGFLFSVSHALGKDIIDFVSLSINKIKKHTGSWSSLLHGSIINYFPTLELFEQEMVDVFIGDKISVFQHWNTIFIEITQRYWAVSVVHFYDKIVSDSVSDITLKIPEYIQSVDEFKSNNNHLIVIEKDRTFYPVYSIYKDVFFKSGSVDSKLYNPDSQIVNVINNIISFHFNQLQEYPSINLYLLKKFTLNSKYNIDSLLINNANNCYGVLLKYIPDKKVVPFYLCTSKTDKALCLNNEVYSDLAETFKTQNKKNKSIPFYVPLVESYNKPGKTPVKFDPINVKHIPEWKQLNTFINELNTYITEYSKYKMKDTFYKDRLIYPLIIPKHWVLYNSDVIGFKSLDMQFRHQPMSKKKALSIINTKFIQMLYDPIDINKVIFNNTKPTQDNRYKLINKSLYNHYLYPIIILEFINVLNKQRNNSIRTQIKHIINKITVVDLQVPELQKLLMNYPTDLILIRRILNSISFNKNTSTNNFMSKKPFAKSNALELIDKSVFQFDRKMLDGFKSMKYTQLLKELKIIFENLTINKDPNINDDFPNMIMSCESDNPYCKNKKLMIEKNKLHDILEIMAADILNPFKSKYIFSPIFIKNTVDKFNFIVRDNEYITITM